MSPSSNTRWCPTPEQLMILEELYRRGLKTPNASQIQKITAHLSFYGKIQGKNVFYWFQNHKARDRQKLRKKLAKQLHQQHLLQQHLIYNQQFIDPAQTQYSTLDHFQAPNSVFHQLSNCYNAQNLHAQGSGISEEAPEGLMMMRHESWRSSPSDLPKDCLIRTYGHDSTMINMDVGPTLIPCCTNNNNKPLQTLELFPLRSSSSATTHDENPVI
ncbi:hypothetical protein DH2020_012187 [Rehmannia glutinosa]|uniref:Homeobox domain-containing protein n=1 Tax=Rehmannia glutinosa TaxID=99300 RepID=A0ABR0W406_REHGL